MKVCAIDPGTKAAATITADGKNFETISWNVAAKSKTKSHPGEPKYFRLMHLWRELQQYASDADVIVCEGALGFMKGKSAIEASHKYRAIIELFAGLMGKELVVIEPNDLKQFALGKRSGGKDEMIAAANRLGYEGHEDNEADSFLIAKWFCNYRLEGMRRK